MRMHIDDLLTERDPLIGQPLVINVDKDKDRWDDICHHLAQWDIVPLRFPAVTNVTLPCLPPSMLEFPSIVSLSLSHAAINRHCLMNTQRRAWLILEDDCRFVENPKEVILETLSTLEKRKTDWSVISLGCYSYDSHGKKPDLPDSPTLVSDIKDWFPWGAHSYIVNSVHSQRLIGEISSCVAPVDHVLLTEISLGRGYLRRPSVTYQEEYPSYRGNCKLDTKSRADLHDDVIKEITKDNNVNIY